MDRAPWRASAASAISRFSSLNQIFDSGASAGGDLPPGRLGGHALAQVALDTRPGGQRADLLADRTVLDGRAATPTVPAGDVDEPEHGIGATAATAYAGALLGQAGPGDLPALARAADHVGRGDPHLVEEHLVEVGRAGHLAQWSYVDAGTAHVEDEGRDAGRALDRLGARQQVAVVGPLGPRAPHLLTHDHVGVTVALGSGLQRGEVAAGVGLTEQLGPDVVAPRHRRQVGRPAARRCRNA